MNDFEKTANDQSVTLWIGELKDGNDEASRKLWERYFDKLTRLAARRLGSAPRRIADEEDVAVSVFESLCRGAAEGRFEKMQDRSDLWKLMTAMVGMKAVDQIRRQTAQKRGGQNVRGESIFAGSEASQIGGLSQMLHGDPTPEFIASMEEQLTEMFRILPDKSLREVARLRFEGYPNEEIAQSLDISLRSVERKLKVIRELWISSTENP